MPNIRYKVPYECVVAGADTASGKPFSNTLYFACDAPSLPPEPAYGDYVADTDEQVFVDQLAARLVTSLGVVTATSWHVTSIVAQAIIGRAFATPANAIVSLASGGAITLVNTAAPHGLSSGQTVSIAGVGTPAAANGLWVVTVLSGSSFSIPLTTSDPWSGSGSVQLAQGGPAFLYADKLETAVNISGSVAGDALPLFSSGSVRRLNYGVGRHWRSRISVSPLPESHWVDGTLSSTGIAAWAVAVGLLQQYVLSNAANTDFVQRMHSMSVSRALAFAQPTPFPSADAWAKYTSSWAVRPNNGSIIRRKPRLTTPITVV